MRKMVMAALAATMLSGTANAATQIVSGGKLTGATGVTVGTLGIYDVNFTPTCAGAFGACTAANFNFNNSDDASRASQALLDQVFLDTAAGQFDSDPSLTQGCTGSFCNVLVPYTMTGNVFVYLAASNGTAEIVDYVVGGAGTAANTDNRIFSTYVSFTRTGDVLSASRAPESATWAMMTLGFGLIGSAMRRRSRRIVVA